MSLWIYLNNQVLYEPQLIANSTNIGCVLRFDQVCEMKTNSKAIEEYHDECISLGVCAVQADTHYFNKVLYSEMSKKSDQLMLNWREMDKVIVRPDQISRVFGQGQSRYRLITALKTLKPAINTLAYRSDRSSSFP